jgi:hypothetical protein
MEISVNIIYFLCIFISCKTAEITQTHSVSDTLRHKDSHNANNSDTEGSNQLRFYKRNDVIASEQIQHSNTKWSPWIPIPKGHNLRYNTSNLKENIVTSSTESDDNIIATGNNATTNNTELEDTVSNGTFNETSSNATHQSAFLNDNNRSHVVTSSSESTKRISNAHNAKTRISHSKGVTYYFWDTIFLILKCFKYHWKTGVVDCVTARASTLLEGLLGIGGTRRHQVLNKEQNELVPYNEILEETPRNDEGLEIGDDDEYEDEDEEDVYDEGTRDSSEGELV